VQRQARVCLAPPTCQAATRAADAASGSAAKARLRPRRPTFAQQRRHAARQLAALEWLEGEGGGESGGLARHTRCASKVQRAGLHRGGRGKEQEVAQVGGLATTVRTSAATMP